MFCMCDYFGFTVAKIELIFEKQIIFIVFRLNFSQRTKKDGTGGRPSDRLRSVYSTLSFSCFQNEALMDIELEMAST